MYLFVVVESVNMLSRFSFLWQIRWLVWLCTWPMSNPLFPEICWRQGTNWVWWGGFIDSANDVPCQSVVFDLQSSTTSTNSRRASQLVQSLIFNYWILKCKFLDTYRTDNWHPSVMVTKQENVKSLPLSDNSPLYRIVLDKRHDHQKLRLRDKSLSLTIASRLILLQSNSGLLYAIKHNNS
jgi:hypothetical protein